MGDDVRWHLPPRQGGESLPDLGGKHGAAHNGQVLHRRRAPHRAGHECRTIILPTEAFVHALSATAGGPSRDRAVFFCAPAAALRSSSAAAAIAGRSTATPAAAHTPGARRFQEAGRRYQASLRGRRAHAARMGRYRARRQSVTHHGSPAPAPHDLLPPDAMMPTADDASPGDALRPPGLYCHWCGRRCLSLLRLGFLRRRRHRGRAGADLTGPMRDGDAI